MDRIYLPLSWFLCEENKTGQKVIAPVGKGLDWFSILGIDKKCNLFRTILTRDGNKILIRGVGGQLKKLLSEYSFYSYDTGREAIIKLNNELTWKKSVRELIKRGRRRTSFFEAKYSPENLSRLEELKLKSRHSDEPVLKNLFNSCFIEGMKLFVVKDEQDQWLGALLLSKNDISKYHCELLLKRR